MNELKLEFPLDPSICYLNHAAVSPWPKRTMDSIQAFASENVRFGATNYPDWIEAETTLRERLKTLIGAKEKDDIALLKSTSEALSVVAFGIKWEVGDEIILPEQEFPSNSIVWEALTSRFGVQVKKVRNAEGRCSAQDLIDACSKSTRLISTSSVQYTNGTMMDLVALGKHCSQNNILFCVDAIQSIGAIQADVDKWQADFVMADGHKWMMGPEGLALFYCRPEIKDLLSLQQYGWHMVEDSGNYDTPLWEIAHTARRFECGSPNMLGIHGLNASLSLILEVGISNIENMIQEKVQYLIEELSSLQSIKMDKCLHSKSGIINFQCTNYNHQKELHLKLMQEGVICAQRGGGIRFSPHFYTPESVLEKSIKILKKCI